MNIFSKKPKDETYVIRRGVSKKKDPILWDLILFFAFVLLGIWIFFFWSVQTGLSAFDRGDYAGCVERLSRVTFLTPLDAGLHYKIALAQARIGHHQEVIELCRKVLGMQQSAFPQFLSGVPRPSITEIYLGMTISYLALRRYSDAIVYAQLILTQVGDDALTYKLLATAHFGRSFAIRDSAGIRAARKFFDKAYELDPRVFTPEDWNMVNALRDELMTEGRRK